MKYIPVINCVDCDYAKLILHNTKETIGKARELAKSEGGERDDPVFIGYCGHPRGINRSGEHFEIRDEADPASWIHEKCPLDDFNPDAHGKLTKIMKRVIDRQNVLIAIEARESRMTLSPEFYKKEMKSELSFLNELLQIIGGKE